MKESLFTGLGWTQDTQNNIRNKTSSMYQHMTSVMISTEAEQSYPALDCLVVISTNSRDIINNQRNWPHSPGERNKRKEMINVRLELRSVCWVVPAGVRLVTSVTTGLIRQYSSCQSLL